MEICGVKISGCICTIEKGKCDGRHLCNQMSCGGSWTMEAPDIMSEPILIPTKKKTWKEHIEFNDWLRSLPIEKARVALDLGMGMS